MSLVGNVEWEKNCIMKDEFFVVIKMSYSIHLNCNKANKHLLKNIYYLNFVGVINIICMDESLIPHILLLASHSHKSATNNYFHVCVVRSDVLVHARFSVFESCFQGLHIFSNDAFLFNKFMNTAWLCFSTLFAY